MIKPAEVAIGVDSIYVCSSHKLQKFTSSGEYVGQEGNKKGHFWERELSFMNTLFPGLSLPQMTVMHNP